CKLRSRHIHSKSSKLSYSGFQMSVYSFENKKSVPLRVLSFHFAVGKMKTAIIASCDRLLMIVIGQISVK
ncbi:MAG: hypothetical protein ACK47D_11825, partial [Pseudanabaena sp.]